MSTHHYTTVGFLDEGLDVTAARFENTVQIRMGVTAACTLVLDEAQFAALREAVNAVPSPEPTP